MQTSKAIQHSYIEIHSKNLSQFPLEMQPDDSFAIFYMKMAKAELTQKPIFLLFSIDKTGSMDEYANKKSKKTKLDYLIHTFHKILYYLLEKDIRITIRVHAFHSIVDVTIENTILTPKNIEHICMKIDELYAEGPTDIGLALSMAEMELTKYKETYPTHQIVHLFMTDGEATTGESDPKILSRYINEEYTNIFFGFGNDHNAHLLQSFSQKKNANYQFVDHIENTGMIFGESIHRFLYPAIESAKFVIENGWLYDWKTNEWVGFLEEPLIVGESEKTFHIRTCSPETVHIHVYGIDCSQYDPYDDEEPLPESLLDVVTSLPELIPLDDTISKEESDLTQYMFRQKVQELLFQITHGMGQLETKQRYVSQEKKKYKKEMESFFRIMRKYMRLNGLLDDPFMTLLCDDIHVTYKNIDSRYAYMYAVSRQTSQGRQQSYHTSSQDEEEEYKMKFVMPRLNRQPNHFTFDEDQIYTQREIEDFACDSDSLEEEKPYHIESNPLEDYLSEDELIYYRPMKSHTTCYSTPTSRDAMEGMSFRFL